jgi:hypothetical protein
MGTKNNDTTRMGKQYERKQGQNSMKGIKEMKEGVRDNDMKKIVLC